MSLDRQPAWFLWFLIVAAPLVTLALVAGAWEQWHSDVWERGVYCGRRYCVRSPGEDAFLTAALAVVALAISALMALKALAEPIVPRSSLTKAARAICAASFLLAGLASAARACALMEVA